MTLGKPNTKCHPGANQNDMPEIPPVNKGYIFVADSKCRRTFPILYRKKETWIHKL
jgi:hypothetical protein